MRLIIQRLHCVSLTLRMWLRWVRIKFVPGCGLVLLWIHRVWIPSGFCSSVVQILQSYMHLCTERCCPQKRTWLMFTTTRGKAERGRRPSGRSYDKQGEFAAWGLSTETCTSDHTARHCRNRIWLEHCADRSIYTSTTDFGSSMYCYECYCF